MSRINGTKEPVVWTDKIIVGGSDPLQSSTVTIIEGSGTTTKVTSTDGVFTNLSGTNVNATDASVAGSTTLAGPLLESYADGRGNVIQNLAAEAIISGGMWVVGSDASGTTPTFVAKPAPVHAGQPLGICLSTTASGSNAPILTRGFYKGLIAEDTVAVGDGVSMGSGAKINTVLPAVAGHTRGTVMMGGGSEAVVSVYLW